MTADKDKIEKVVRTIAEARAMGITVLPPDVNESEIGFTVVYSADAESRDSPPQAGGAALRRASQASITGRPVAIGGKLNDPMKPRIRFGLGAVKGIGSAALEAIFDSRAGSDAVAAQPAPATAKLPFADMFDFACRVDLRRVNKAVVEALVQCGAMDSMHDPAGITRARAFAAIDLAIERGKTASADRESGQTDLFGMLAADAPPAARASLGNGGTFPQAQPWERKELLKREKSTLGFYLSGHPLDGYREELKRFCNATTASVANLSDGTQVTIGGVIEDFRQRPTKAGGKIGFFQLEDPVGRVEVIVREKALEAHREILQTDVPVLVTAIAREERDQGGGDGEVVAGGEVKLLLDSVTPLVDAFRSKTRSVRVRVNVERIDRQKLVDLRRTLMDFPGSCPVTLQLVNSGWDVTMRTRKILVDPSEQMLARLELLFGEKVCELR
jgi:DNA polymerase-3 subunit alpha